MNNQEQHKATLASANAAIAQGDYEGFLSYCTDDTRWSFVGERTLAGNEAVRRWMKATYQEPPQFRVAELIAERNLVTAIGAITLPGTRGEPTEFSFCDVWRFRDGKVAELTAFVIEGS